jgi:hypothetical protein
MNRALCADEAALCERETEAEMLFCNRRRRRGRQGRASAVHEREVRARVAEMRSGSAVEQPARLRLVNHLQWRCKWERV